MDATNSVTVTLTRAEFAQLIYAVEIAEHETGGCADLFRAAAKLCDAAGMDSAATRHAIAAAQCDIFQATMDADDARAEAWSAGQRDEEILASVWDEAKIASLEKKIEEQRVRSVTVNVRQRKIKLHY